MASVTPAHQLPVLYNDLQPAESLHDVLHTLDHLSYIVNEIFTRVDTRIEQERLRITQIKHRVAVCGQKVSQIKGSKQAITVFSTAKFPAPKSLPAYPTLFGEIDEKHSPYRDVEDIQYLTANAKNSSIGNRELTSDLHDIITRLNANGQDLQRVEFIMEDHGLGALPATFKSVGSILLFNSSVNLYEQYQTQDNLITAGRERIVQEEKVKGLASAPMTIINGEALPDIQGLDLMYKPSMGQMSSLALPENLPLDFLANIHFAKMDLPSIAPSAHSKANYSLPQLTDGSSDGKSALSSSGPPPPPSSSGPPPPPPSANMPPPPPPPSSGGPPPPPPSSGGPPPPPPNAGGPPPPPPPPSAGGPPPPPPGPASMPPPPPAMMQPAPSASLNDIDEDDNAAPAPNSRSSLLDAIKGMSVKSLRNKEDSATTQKKVQKKVEEKKPITIQDALKSRLSRLNSAISGKGDKESRRRDSLVIKQARESMKMPGGMSSPETDHKKSKADDDMPKFNSKTEDNSDTESDNSEISFGPGGGGLFSANPAVSTMLSKAKQKHGSDSDSDGGGDWD